MDQPGPSTVSRAGLEALEETLGGAEMVERVGRGPETEVYRTRTDRGTVATKIWRGDDKTNGSAHGFRREAALLATLDHPAFPDVYQIGRADDVHFALMEFIEGDSLAEILSTRGFDWEGVVAWASELAEALAFVHDRNLVHRDIKPQNILFSEDGRTRLIDFGLVERANATEGDAEVVGTLQYAAPEQLGGLDLPVDHRADLYSLGVVLYEALAGAPPFDTEEASELLHRHTAVEPTPLGAAAPEIPEPLARLVEDLLQKEPDERPNDAWEVRDRLHELDDEEPRPENRLEQVGLVGREALFDLFLADWQAAEAADGPRLVGLEGEAGVGKSHFIERLTRKLETLGPAVFLEAAESGDTSPLGPLRRSLDARFDAHSNEADEPDLGPLADELSDEVRDALGVLDRSDATSEPEAEGEILPEQFYDEVASFLLKVAEHLGGAVFILEDLHWCDTATVRTLRHLAERNEDAPLLVVGTFRPGAEAVEPIFGALEADNERVERRRMDRFDDEQLAAFVGNYLGTEHPPDELLDRLQTASGGLPFLAIDYLFTMIDAGVLEPHWGTWAFDSAELGELGLSDRAMSFVLQRLRYVDSRTRELLRRMAVLGRRVDPTHAREVLEADGDEVERALSEALGARILEHDPPGYRFVHDRLRETLLESVEDATRRKIHQDAARWSWANADSPDKWYRIADHFLLGDPDRTPNRAFEALRRAGSSALDAFSFREAYRYFSRAEELADAHDIATDVEFRTALGRACAQTGRLQDAKDHFEWAASHAESPVLEARIRARISEVYLWSTIQSAPILDQYEAAVKSLGMRTWDSTAALVVAGILSLLGGLAIRLTGLGQGTASGENRERLEVFLLHSRLAQHGEYWEMNAPRSLSHVFRGFYAANRLGTSVEQLKNFATGSSLFAALGFERLSNWYADRARETARALGGERYEVFAELRRGWALTMLGRTVESEEIVSRELEERGHLLATGDFTMSVADLTWNLSTRGHTARATTWDDVGRARLELSQTHSPEGFGVDAATAARQGYFEAARAEINSYLASIERVDGGRFQRALAFAAEVVLARLQRDWESLEEAVDHWYELEVDPDTVPIYIAEFYVNVAYARLTRAREAAPDAAEQHRDGARDVLEEFRHGGWAEHPNLKIHERVAASELDWHRERRERAESRLQEAARIAYEFDSRSGLYEIRLRRARRFAARGRDDAAHDQARAALQLASDEGWTPRRQHLLAEFPKLSTGPTSDPLRTLTSRSDASEDPVTGAYLDALVRVSMAASQYSDLADQVAEILREVVKILGAERGIAFLRGEQVEERVAVDADGKQLSVDAYADDVVDSVASNHEPLVVHGGDSRSSEFPSLDAHGIRSVAAAPLSARENFHGVIYLDNRLATGVFSERDLDILRALGNHIPIAVESVRTARLEMEVETERRQRELAEALRDSMTSMSETLDVARIFEVLLEAVADYVPFDDGWCARVRGEQLLDGVRRSTDSNSSDSNTRRGAPPVETLEESRLLDELAASGRIKSLSRTNAPDLADDPAVSADANSWLGAPLVFGDECQGVFVLESRAADAFDETHTEIAETFGQQTGLALQNAQLATVDPLTGLFNRRYFFELAEREFAKFERYETPVSIAMLDVDHFKRLNDEYGHAAGDHALESIADYCKNSIRDTDLVGRYGGEEFLVLMPETKGTEAEQFAQRLRTGLEEKSIQWEGNELPVTASIGVTQVHVSDDNVNAAVDRADQALLKAKREGRNRVVVEEADSEA